MANSPSHKVGQMIGDFLEWTFEPILREIADEYDLYLDVQGKRTARRGKKVSWTDEYGNKHDLDFVIEANGTDQNIGEPIAFIESAWRRYTKHSRNKAQEIQSAILPLLETYRNSAPFSGVILGGVFTNGALTQLESRGFKVLYIPYDTIVESFQVINFNVSFDEDTSISDLTEIKEVLESLSEDQWRKVSAKLIELSKTEISEFIDELEIVIERQIERVIVTPLYGGNLEFDDIESANAFLSEFNIEDNDIEICFDRLEIRIIYCNGDKIEAEFSKVKKAIRFLRQYI